MIYKKLHRKVGNCYFHCRQDNWEVYVFACFCFL